MNENRENLSVLQDSDASLRDVRVMNNTDTTRIAGNLSRRELMDQINEVSFAVNDLQLFLDTHPDDREALRLMERYMQRRQRLLNHFAETYGPLSMDSMGMSEETRWKWMQQPFPWQQEGGCR